MLTPPHSRETVVTITTTFISRFHSDSFFSFLDFFLENQSQSFRIWSSHPTSCIRSLPILDAFPASTTFQIRLSFHSVSYHFWSDSPDLFDSARLSQDRTRSSAGLETYPCCFRETRLPPTWGWLYYRSILVVLLLLLVLAAIRVRYPGTIIESISMIHSSSQ